jgi:anti-sigma factor RsiW
MSACTRTHLLEGVVNGEAAPGLALEVRAHATRCARCRHELNWLQTEQQLFRQRASRDEVAHLWKGVAQRVSPSPLRWWPRVLGGLAAVLVLSVVLPSWRTTTWQPEAQPRALQSESEQLESGSALSEPEPPCSRLPSGLGFHCGPAVPASVLASR